ncbi:MAG: PKD domain-containing protein [Gammaproteobacteria bacterium]|nr:PKD domain-containing protein [Gammaproteobacteria bacterium]
MASDSHDIMTSVNRIRIAGEVSVEFDELHIGTDYSSVAPYFIPTLPAEDSFDYPTGPLEGQGSVTDPGWYGSWDGDIQVLGIDSLTYTDTGGRQLVTAGRRVEAPGVSYRDLESPLANFLYPEVWISFLIDDFDVGGYWAGISLYNDNQELLFMGKLGASDYLGVHEWPNDQRFPMSETLFGPVFFVVRLRFYESSTEWAYWLNPDLNETPQDSDAVASDIHDFMDLVNRIRIAGEVPVDFDELRIGTSYSSVAPFIEPNQAPFAHAGPDQTVYVDETCQAQVTLDGSDSSDPDGDTLTYTWEGSFGQVDGVNPTVTLGLGIHDITLTVSDGELSDTDTVNVFVEDITPPSIDTISASPDVIWPPNHKMVPVTISIAASDNCDTNLISQIISIVSNEPENGLGDGDTAPDWEITGDLTASLRAERSGNESGRVYTITVRCTDSAGNSTVRQVTVTVPHDQQKK